MKCGACDYLYENNYIDEKIGDEEFIRINGYFEIREDFEDKKVSLYACPKCNTVQVDKFDY